MCAPSDYHVTNQVLNRKRLHDLVEEVDPTQLIDEDVEEVTTQLFSITRPMTPVVLHGQIELLTKFPSNSGLKQIFHGHKNGLRLRDTVAFHSKQKWGIRS